MRGEVSLVKGHRPQGVIMVVFVRTKGALEVFSIIFWCLVLRCDILRQKSQARWDMAVRGYGVVGGLLMVN